MTNMFFAGIVLTLIYAMQFFKKISIDSLTFKSVAVINPFKKKIFLELKDVESIKIEPFESRRESIVKVQTKEHQYEINIFLSHVEYLELEKVIEGLNEHH